jgi:hypothetical protein
MKILLKKASCEVRKGMEPGVFRGISEEMAPGDKYSFRILKIRRSCSFSI